MNVSLIAIALDYEINLKKFKEENNFSMPIIADPKAKIIKPYNVYRLGKLSDLFFGKAKLAVPTSYLIGTDGIIRWVFSGTREDRPAMDQITQAIQENLPALSQ